MKFTLTIANKSYEVSKDGVSCAIPLDFYAEQPQHFGASSARKKPMQVDGFVGDTNQGGSCNVNIITINPHCNSTHTENIGHIQSGVNSMPSNVSNSYHLTELITVKPISGEEFKKSAESYVVDVNSSDQLITRKMLENTCLSTEASALMIRTLPNEPSKKQRKYGDSSMSPYFSSEAIKYLNQTSIEHLLVDFPSIDRMHDQGLLANHHAFFQDEKKTITELIYVPDEVNDGTYLLHLGCAVWQDNAVPSNPVLFKLELMKGSV